MPNNWAITSFEEIVELISGRDLETSSCNDIKEGIPYLIGASNIVKRSLFITRWTTKPIVISQKNDILISCKGTIGEVIRNTIGDIHIARQFMALRNNSIVDTNYIELYIRAILKRIKSDARGVIPGISREDILCREILLPPLNEQKRIVLEASKLISIIEKINVDKNELVKAIAAYKLTILQLAITGKLVPQDLSDEPAIDLLRGINPNYKPCDNRHYENKPFLIPDSWLWVMGKDLFLPMKNCKPSGDYFKYIDIDSIDNQDCVIKCPKVLPVTAAPSRATRYTQVGDILFSMVRPYLKNIAIVTEGNCIASTGFYVCSPNEALFSKYCYYLLISPYVINGLTQFMKGDNSPSINNAHINEWLYPLPPLNEQKRIVQKIDEIFNYLDSIVAEL